MRLLPIASVLLAPLPFFGQPTRTPLSFEVASVKPASAPIATKDEYTEGYNAGMRAGLSSLGMRITGRRVNITDNTLKDLIRLAYLVKEYQISAPAWMSSEKYEVIANMPAASDRSQAPEMLKSLLDTRFHLQLHTETRQLAVYALVVAKSGPRLAAGGSIVWTDSARGHLRAANSTLATFADKLTKLAGHPVVDETGIRGTYDFDLTFDSELNTSPGDASPMMGAALAGVGLKLEKRTVPMNVLIVDRADKIPAEN